MSDSEDPSLVEYTRRVWQPRARRELSQDDCLEIQRNVFGFLRVLRDWAQTERDQEVARVGQPAIVTSPPTYQEHTACPNSTKLNTSE